MAALVKYPVENFRPISGTVLFRSSNLNDLCEKDIEDISDLGIKAIIDFRSVREGGGQRQSLLDLYFQPFKATAMATEHVKQRRDTELNVSTAAPKGRHLYVSLMEDDVVDKLYAKARWYVKIIYWFCLLLEFWLDKWITMRVLALLTMDEETTPYKNMQNYITNCGHKILTVLTLLKDTSNIPAVLVCEYGRDRTGVVAMLLQVLCGVEEATVCREYARSQDELKVALVSLRKAVKRFGVSAEFLKCRQEWMADLIQFINNRYGSVPEYLKSIGFSSEDQEMLLRNISKA